LLPEESTFRPGDPIPSPEFIWLGANFAVRAEAAARIGTLDEMLGPGSRFLGGEELDYRLRAAKAGVVQAITPDAVVEHRYGRRYGVRNTWRLLANYAYSTGAVAGKLHLSGDPGGKVWRGHVRREVRDRLVLRYGPAALPKSLLRWRHFESGYRDVVAAFEVDPISNCLRPAAPGSS
jgi:GT2 family glycosyltransferase